MSGSAEDLGVQAMADEMGWKIGVRVWTDPGGAKAAGARRGLGKMRQMELEVFVDTRSCAT